MASVVDQAVDQRDDAGGIWKDFAPFGEGPVGADDRAVVLVTATDEFKQQIGMAIFSRRSHQTPEALAALMRVDADHWWPIIKELGIKAE
jgi:hypothetical protein